MAVEEIQSARRIPNFNLMSVEEEVVTSVASQAVSLRSDGRQ
jgi:hypothetical protein